MRRWHGGGVVALAAALGLGGCGEQAGQAVEGVGEQIDIGRQTQANALLAQIRQQLQAYHGAHDAWPADLDALAAEGDYRVPAAPAGLHWAYDADTGRVSAERD